jgi:hypothetical protein
MSSKPSHSAVRIGLLLTLAALASGCGATGLAWVAESDSPSASGSGEHVDMSSPVVGVARASGPSSISAATEPDPEPTAEARPRLNHTVTLGEVYALPPSDAPGAAPGSGVSVTINNYTNVASPAGYGYGYTSFGYGRGSSGFSGSGAARSSTSGPQAGQNWPAIADHGSSFPLRSAPASPFRGQ